jgi:hypothetical protein
MSYTLKIKGFYDIILCNLIHTSFAISISSSPDLSQQLQRILTCPIVLYCRCCFSRVNWLLFLLCHSPNAFCIAHNQYWVFSLFLLWNVILHCSFTGTLLHVSISPTDFTRPNVSDVKLLKAICNLSYCTLSLPFFNLSYCL